MNSKAHWEQNYSLAFAPAPFVVAGLPGFALAARTLKRHLLFRALVPLARPDVAPPFLLLFAGSVDVQWRARSSQA